MSGAAGAGALMSPRAWLPQRLLDRRRSRLAKQSVVWLTSHPRLVRDGKVTTGRNGWLFVAQDTNDVIAQHTGALRLSQDALERWRNELERRLELFRELGSRYLLLIAPDTHAMYPENLPPGIEPAPARPVHQLLRSLAEAGLPMEVMYPLDAMTAGKQTRPIGSSVESHWTDYGAFLAYERVLDEVSRSHPVRRLDEADIAFQEVVIAGDLGHKLEPVSTGSVPFAVVRYPEARLLYDNCIDGTGSVVVTECPAAPPTTCLVVGDSYQFFLMKFVAESFRRVVFMHSASVDKELAKDFQPDVVVSLMAERFLMLVPDDDGAGQAEHERKKRAGRRTRPPYLLWCSPQWLSPATAERLRTHFLSAGCLREASIASVLSYAGLFPRELLRLRWSDVGEHEIYIREQNKSGSRKKARARSIPMIAPLFEDLLAWRRANPQATGHSLVFPGPERRGWVRGQWKAWSKEFFDPAVRACNLDLEHPADLRQIFATLQVHGGALPGKVAALTGASVRDIEKTYGHLFDRALHWEPVDVEALVRAARRSWPPPDDGALGRAEFTSNGRARTDGRSHALELPSADPSLT